MKLVPLFLAAILLAGCGPNGQPPDQSTQAVVAADSLDASVKLLTAADQLHLIPAEDRGIVAKAITLADADVKAAAASVGAGAFASAMAQANADLAVLVTLRAKYPTTKPSTMPAK